MLKELHLRNQILRSAGSLRQSLQTACTLKMIWTL